MLALHSLPSTPCIPTRLCGRVSPSLPPPPHPQVYWWCGDSRPTSRSSPRPRSRRSSSAPSSIWYNTWEWGVHVAQQTWMAHRLRGGGWYFLHQHNHQCNALSFYISITQTHKKCSPKNSRPFSNNFRHLSACHPESQPPPPPPFLKNSTAHRQVLILCTVQ